MSNYAMWKALHLLYLYHDDSGGLSYSDLRDAGIDCFVDSIQEMIESGLIVEVNGTYELSRSGRLCYRSGVSKMAVSL